MKSFLSVLAFELNNYFKNKSYLLTTVIISVLLIVGLTLPSFVDLSGIIPPLAHEENIVEEDKDTEVEEEEKRNFCILDKNNVLENKNILTEAYPNSNWIEVNNESELEKQVENGDAEGGFLINSLTDYVYFVNNKGIYDKNDEIFNTILETIYRQNALEEADIDAEKVNEIYNKQVSSETRILGKDSGANYFYAYILIFVIYMIIILYGQLVAVSVTSEKSSRAMEVLITSTSSNCLIFGKVFAATIASIIQVGVMIGSGVITYKLNGEAWNGLLDGVFAIPSSILITFAIFGGIGYIFYAFIYAALGALVSKTEDVSKSIGNITFIFLIVFFVAIFGLQNSDSMIVKVASYIPFSSCMTMIIRVAMGSVKIIEIVISAVILIVSTILVGIGSAKIYRMGTLRYGNPIKLTNALKWLKKNNR